MPGKDYSLARQLVSSYEQLDKEYQQVILDAIDARLQADPLLYMRALKQQVGMLAMQARTLYESRQQVALDELLSTVAPTAAILLNLEISLTNQQFHEEGSTLARTLLPYLNQVTDYAFLAQDTIFIMTRFLSSLARHICDTQGAVGAGFMLFALKVNPHVVKDIIDYSGNVTALSSALSYFGYPLAAA